VQNQVKVNCGPLDVMKIHSEAARDQIVDLSIFQFLENGFIRDHSAEFLEVGFV
jgi:hypothetical protein